MAGRIAQCPVRVLYGLPSGSGAQMPLVTATDHTKPRLADFRLQFFIHEHRHVSAALFVEIVLAGQIVQIASAKNVKMRRTPLLKLKEPNPPTRTELGKVVFGEPVQMFFAEITIDGKGCGVSQSNHALEFRITVTDEMEKAKPGTHGKLFDIPANGPLTPTTTPHARRQAFDNNSVPPIKKHLRHRQIPLPQDMIRQPFCTYIGEFTNHESRKYGKIDKRRGCRGGAQAHPHPAIPST